MNGLESMMWMRQVQPTRYATPTFTFWWSCRCVVAVVAELLRRMKMFIKQWFQWFRDIPPIGWQQWRANLHPSWSTTLGIPELLVCQAWTIASRTLGLIRRVRNYNRFVLPSPLSSTLTDIHHSGMTELHYTEALWRLPSGFNCFTPRHSSSELPLSPPPIKKNGFLTVGTFSNIAKLSRSTLRLFAKVTCCKPMYV